ncbi:MAG: GNAT family N-acetyltransferase [Planctomycetaceae bacterium]
MMIEVRSYEGSVEELSQFVVNTWRQSYQGSMLIPDWTPNYLRWQLRLHEPDSEKRLVAAYDSGKLVGVLLFVPMEFELHGKPVRGSHSSWLSVSSEYRGKGVAKALQEGARKAHAELGLEAQVGYVYFGASQSLGPKFWTKKNVANMQVFARVGFWTRVLDFPRAARWNVNTLESVLTRIGAPVTPDPHVPAIPSLTIRPFESDDLPACLKLAESATSQCNFRLVWDENILGNQLQGFGKCLVAVENGEVRGCIGYHVISMLGHTLEPVGVIDLVFVNELSSTGRTALLNSVLLEMKRAGAVAALKMRSGDYPFAYFARWGWYWRWPDSLLTVKWSGEERVIPPVGRTHLLWR